MSNTLETKDTFSFEEGINKIQEIISDNYNIVVILPEDIEVQDFSEKYNLDENIFILERDLNDILKKSKDELFIFQLDDTTYSEFYFLSY